MSLVAGTRLGPYEIQSAIGAGGMGEVYKARDTRLDRSVAIKVLPPALSADPDRRARFEHEAKTIAGLNHSHICTLHDVGDYQGALFLVMEHLAGETLDRRLEKGALPLEQALTIASEIADALAAAHRQGVIHRDLKPGNVILTKAGAKLLDFGLAKLTGHGEHAAARMLSLAPTQASPVTAQGVVVGTLPYMAPEQLEGKAADARTDLWALGAIVYEMVTGKRPFGGESALSLASNIMNAEPPPLVTAQPLAPPSLDRLVRRCLAKSPDDRWESARDVADEFRWLRESSASGLQPGLTVRRAPRRTLAAVAVFGLATALLGAGLMWALRPVAKLPVPAHLSVQVGPAEAFALTGRTAVCWTPDGQTAVFVGRRDKAVGLYTRRLASPEASALQDTVGALLPAVSPDGRWVAFWAQGARGVPNGKIKRVALAGGPAADLLSGVRVPPRGLVYDDRGNLFFGNDADGRVWEIPAQGQPKAITTLGEAEYDHVLPWPLPGGHVLLYTIRRRPSTWGLEEVVAETLATGVRKPLLKSAADARYLPTGHLVFLRQQRLFVVPFDAKRLEVLGKEVPVLDGVAQALTGGSVRAVSGAGQFAVSSTGSLAWVQGSPPVFENNTLVTVTRRGEVTPIPAPPHQYGPWANRLSPDGRRLAVTFSSDLTEEGLWIYDLDRGSLTPVARGGEADFPVWSPDGQRLVFGYNAGRNVGGLAMQSVDADSTAPPQILVKGQIKPGDFSPDGRRVLARRSFPQTDIVAVDVENPKASVEPVLETTSTEDAPDVSPDGRWLAYVSNVSGRLEVYVRPYPGPGRTAQVSIEGGESPAWNPNGRELFFLRVDQAARQTWMMAADFAPGTPPRIGRPHALFTLDPNRLAFSCNELRCYDVSPDGQRFYGVQWAAPDATPPAPPVTHLNLIQNWFEELKAKVPR